MCGLLGFITTETTKGIADRRKFLTQGIIIDTLRGDDSTGVFYKRRDAVANTGAGFFKSVQDGYGFTMRPEFQSIAAKLSTHWFHAAHNRAATTGAVDLEGAHPFQEGGVTLVHNGTLRNDFSLPLTMRDLGVHVDSHALTHNLAAVAPEEAGTIIELIQGAFTLLWYDARDMSFNICRNAERPLHMAHAKHEDTIYFISEDAQLRFLDSRLKIGLEDILIPGSGLHLKWKEGDLMPAEVKTYSPKARSYGANYYGGYGGAMSGYEATADEWQEWTGERHNASASGVRNVNDKDGGTAPVGKPLGPLEDNRVMVGGRRRVIPSNSQAMLLKVGLVPEARMQFTPMEKLPSRVPEYQTVTGHLDSLGWPAIIHRMSVMAVKNNFNSRWMVRPVAVRWLDATHKEPMIICKLVRPFLGPNDKERLVHSSALSRRNGKVASDSTDAASPLIETGTVSPTTPPLTQDTQMRTFHSSRAMGEDYFKGPYGLYVDASAWVDFTDGGCDFCGDDLFITDSEEIMWYDGTAPLCPTCCQSRGVLDYLELAAEDGEDEVIH